MTGQRDHEGRRRSGIWLPDVCWNWLADNTAEGMTRSDLVEGLILLAMDEEEAADPAPTDPCARCGHTWVRHKIGRCSMCSQSCPGFVAADPAPTDRPNVGGWRVGRSVGRTIYNDDDILIGVMDTPKLAAIVVEAVNRAADPAPTDHVRRARRRSVGVVTPRMIATDTAPTGDQP